MELTTGVKTCCSTGFCCTVLKASSERRHTDSNIATRANNTPAVNQSRRNSGRHCPKRRKQRLKAEEYHLN